MRRIFSFCSAKTETHQKKIYSFLLFLTKILVTGSPKFTRYITFLLPIFLFYKYFCTSQNFLIVFYKRYCKSIFHRKLIGMVVKAAGSEVSISRVRTPLSTFIFFCLHLPHLQTKTRCPKCGACFCPPKPPHFFEKSLKKIPGKIDALRRIYALRLFGKWTQITVRWV